MTKDDGISTDMSPRAALNQMLVGYMITQAIHVAARLGVADVLEDGPKSYEEIARLAGADAGALYRVLRLLASQGVFAELEGGIFTLTPRAALLREGVPDSLRVRALIVGDYYWRGFGELYYSVKTGKAAFEHAYGITHYDYLAQNVEVSNLFSALMTENAEANVRAIAAAYDFSRTKTIVDVAGAHGALLTTILKINPEARGILFDLPHVVAGARKVLETERVVERCELLGGNFFESVPTGGDLYIMKECLGDWDDQHALMILKNCHRAMTGQVKLLLVDTMVPSGNEPSPAKNLDVILLMLSGGRLRSEAEYRDLVASAGLRVARTIPTQSPWQHTILEVVTR